ncbi:MAG: hypothetical protein ABIH34_07405 [Nanoarchaeota archaeon]
MHKERAIRLVVITCITLLVITVIGFSLSSQTIRKTLTIMEKNVCNNDGVCDADESDICGDCPKNIAGQAALTVPESGTQVQDRILMAVALLAAVTLFEMGILASRK